MNLAPVSLEWGEVYGSLKVLEKLSNGKYRVGCTCGSSKDAYRANALMRAGGIRKCSRCRKAESKCKPDGTT